MQLSESLIAKFQQAHLEEFGYAISTEQAEAELIELAELVRLTVRSDNKDTKAIEEMQPTQATKTLIRGER
jgi:hypothetical protein